MYGHKYLMIYKNTKMHYRILGLEKTEMESTRDQYSRPKFLPSAPAPYIKE